MKKQTKASWFVSMACLALFGIGCATILYATIFAMSRLP